MPYDAHGNEQACGGNIPVEERTAYRTYRDKHHRTNAGVLVANHPVTSTIRKEVFPPHNGFVTANHEVAYVLNGVPVLSRRCQIILRPDFSEASINVTESFFADVTGRGRCESVTITREQFEMLKEIWK